MIIIVSLFQLFKMTHEIIEMLDLAMELGIKG